MGKIVDVQAPFASLQVAAGARCIQVFDSWWGRWDRTITCGSCSPIPRADRAHPANRRACYPLRNRGIGILPGIARGGRRRDGRGLARKYRPGLDRYQLSLGGTGQLGSGGAICAAAGAAHEDRRIAEAHRSRPGHIFNVGHGILPETPVENVKACVEMVREFRP